MTVHSPPPGQEQLRTLLESIGDGFVALDGDGRFTFVNAQAERFLACDRSELLGRTWWEAFPDSRDSGFGTRFRQAVAAKEEISFEEFYPPLDTWFEVRTFPFEGGLSILFQDIGARRRSEAALRENEELYRSLVENIDLGITLIDRQHRILMTNAAQGRLLGKPACDFVGRHCFREFEQRSAICPHCPGTRAMASGRPASAEAEGVRGDGSHLVVRIQAFPLFDPDGVARRFIEVVEDISAQRQAEQALRRSEARFRSIFEHAGAGMCLLGEDGRYFRCNPAFQQFIGYSEAELRTLTPLDLTHPADREETRRQFATMADRQRHTFSYEKRYVRKDGRVVWGHVSTAWLIGEDGRLNFSVGLIQDITERKQAEISLRRALRETAAARDQTDAILRSVADGLLVTAANRRLTHLNPAAEELLGLELATVRQLDPARLPIDPILRRQLQAPLAADAAERQCEFTRSDSGGERVIQARTAPIFAADGSAIGTITLLRDISREREIDQIKSEFISTAAHELRTPLASVMGYAELLLQLGQLPRPEHRDYLQRILEKSEVLAHIIDDLLDLSRIESGRLISLERTPTDLGALLRDVVDQFRPGSPRHRLELELPATPLVLPIDREKVLQVMENLLSNAVKYAPGGGPIRVAARAQAKGCRIEVADQGIGMSRQQLARVFDKFYRADASDTAVRGLGLGMTIVKKIVEGHGGTIEVDSAPGEGTTVTVLLPWGPQQRPESAGEKEQRER